MFRKFLAFVSILMLAGASNVMAGNGSGGGGGGTSQLTEDEEDDLVYMRLEEKLARDAYITLYGSWGNTIFLNIYESEQQHTDAVEKLIDKYAIPDPVLDESLDHVGDFFEIGEDKYFEDLFKALMTWGHESEFEAMNVGAAIEEKDMRDIQKAIDATDNTDIVSTYENLLCGSRNHLRAFVANIDAIGKTLDPPLSYDPPLYFDELTELEIIELKEIAYSETEQCGGK